MALLTAALATALFAQGPAALTEQARTIIRERMVDPESFRIRNTRVRNATVGGRSVTILCGEFNSRNRMGGYTGFKTFIFDPVVMRGVLSVESDLGLNFFAADGSGDVSSDPRAAVRAGANPAALTSAYERSTNYAVAFLPVCLGLS